MLETLQQMGQGFVHALTWINLLAMAGGVALGIVIGCLPGLSAAMGVALMLPLTFTMPADTGLIVLGAIYCGAIFGGSIFGDHCSPISDTTIMSCATSGCDIIDHVKTQIPYAAICAGVSIVLYTVLGFVM